MQRFARLTKAQTAFNVVSSALKKRQKDSDARIPGMDLF
jgi:hypothetical protein